MFRMILLFLLTLRVQAAQLPWRIADLMMTPQSWAAPNPESGVKAVWIQGPAYKGKPTRAFACYSIPVGKTKAPGMVLIHGGGGTAFAEWVRMWNREGFAAIAVDTVGTIPDKPVKDPFNPTRKRHEFSGPAGWGDFDNVDTPVTNQ